MHASDSWTRDRSAPSSKHRALAQETPTKVSTLRLGTPGMGWCGHSGGTSCLHSTHQVDASSDGPVRAFFSAAVVADMIMAEMSGHGDAWKLPEWLPEHYLTWNR